MIVSFIRLARPMKFRHQSEWNTSPRRRCWHENCIHTAAKPLPAILAIPRQLWTRWLHQARLSWLFTTDYGSSPARVTYITRCSGRCLVQDFSEGLGGSMNDDRETSLPLTKGKKKRSKTSSRVSLAADCESTLQQANQKLLNNACISVEGRRRSSQANSIKWSSADDQWL